MLVVTSGILLHTTKYADTSVIAQIFTREIGLRSYIVKNVRCGKSHVKQNLLQPMAHLDLVVYNSPKANINHIKEIHQHLPSAPACNADFVADNSPYDPTTRNALLFFMNEVTYKVMKDEEVNIPYFDYIAETLHEIHTAAEKHLSFDPNLPIHFLLNTAHHLGIFPQDNYNPTHTLFDLHEGHFVNQPTDTTLDHNQSLLLHHFLNHTAQSATLTERTSLINNLLQYFQTHLDSFKNFKSHEILHALLEQHNTMRNNC